MVPCQGDIYSSASSSQLCFPCTAESPDHNNLSIIPSLIPLQCTSKEILYDTLPFHPSS
jgi:hypothetical protein